jgi:hypothetical protein
MTSRLFKILITFSALICLATIALWLRGHYARDSLWYSTDTMRYSIHSYRGRIWLWSLSIAPDSSAMVWTTRRRIRTGFQVDSVSDSWYAPFVGPRKGIVLETDFTEAHRGWSVPGRQWLGFRYVSTDTWYPKAQLQQGYPTASSRAIFIPHWAIITLTATLPTIATAQLMRNRHRRRDNLCPKCGYDLRATPSRCPECGHEPKPVQ